MSMLKKIGGGFLLGLIITWSACEMISADHSNHDSRSADKYLRGEMPLQHGMELFNLHCASCHDFSENGIGPNLAGITSEVSKDWLVKFIHNPPAMIEEGDERAVKQFEKYQQYMPPFPMLQDQDMEDLLAFIHKFSEGEKRAKNNRPGGLINPITERIDTSSYTLVLEEKFLAPASSDAVPTTRINKMNAIDGGRVFLHDIRGKMYEVFDGTSLEMYFNLVDQFPDFIDNPGKGTGFASWAFHPNFNETGLFYTTHSEKAGAAEADFGLPDSIGVTLQFVLVEWTATDPQAKTFSGNHRELLRVDMPGGAHTFQEVTFNPLAKPGTSDFGLLYLGIGDGGSALRHTHLCDGIEDILSSVIRIDPQGSNSANGKYGIPADNPFVDSTYAVKEVWARGFRNPHRICWDESGSGKMFITNVGQHSLEEVNLGIAGGDYGWPYREGTFLFDPDANPELVYPLPDDDKGYTYPVVQYDHDEGSAVSGGFAYAGRAVAQLKGKYIFGDMSRGTLFYSDIAEMESGSQAPLYRLNVAIDGKRSDMETISGHKRVDLRIGYDAAGELYLMTKGNGGVYKVVDCWEDSI